MLPSMRLMRRRHSWVWRFATAIALLAQCWVAAASLADSRGLGASAHVEADGINKHFAHNEATCAACLLLAMHAPAPTHAARTLPVLVAPRAEFVVPTVVPVSAEPRSNPSRAPPSDY